MRLEEIIESLEAMDPASREKAIKMAMDQTKSMVWRPNPGPQTDAYFCEADELFYGGQAGGGKTDVVCGLALTAHEFSLLLRRTNKEASLLAERVLAIKGDREGWNGQDHVLRLDGKRIDIGGVQHDGDEQKYKGSPHDFIGFDEISDFTESQYRFIIGWNRTTTPGQRCRVVATGNPPTRPEGFWVLRYWGAWVDPNNPNPAKPGELRWYTTIAGEDHEVDGRGPHLVKGEKVVARSRTFIPAKLSDNYDLAKTDYDSVLASLPEELRAAYRDGRFDVSMRDDDFQVIPSKWVIEAQGRWKPDGYQENLMSAMAVDPAGGGNDAEEIVYRHGTWFSEPITTKGIETADGAQTVGRIIKYRKHNAPVIIDMEGGWGGDVALVLRENGIQNVHFKGSNSTIAKSREGGLGFFNTRAEAWWRMREELNPEQEGGAVLALPPGAEIRADLATPRWKMTTRGVQLESKDDIRRRLGRSPGKGDALVMCLYAGGKSVQRQLLRNIGSKMQQYANVGYKIAKRRRI